LLFTNSLVYGVFMAVHIEKEISSYF
jgi:hypothetical protein